MEFRKLIGKLPSKFKNKFKDLLNKNNQKDIEKLAKKKSRDLLQMVYKGKLDVNTFFSTLLYKLNFILPNEVKLEEISKKNYDDFFACLKTYQENPNQNVLNTVNEMYKLYGLIKKDIKKAKGKAPMAEKLIDTMFDNENVKREFKDGASLINTDDKFKKYAKMDIDKLDNLYQCGKITDVDFHLLVIQKMNNMFGTDDQKRIESIFKTDAFKDLTNPYQNYYKNLFKYDPASNNHRLIYSFYKTYYENEETSIVNRIHNAKYELTKKKLVNKVKKQATHLMGETKLKLISRETDQTIINMAEKNVLTIPDLKKALQYNLENNYLGYKFFEKKYNKNKDNYCDELKKFCDYTSKDTREKRIQEIKDYYNKILDIINNTKDITYKIETTTYKGKNDKGIDETFTTINQYNIKIGKYSQYISQIEDSLKYIDEIVKKCSNVKKGQEILLFNGKNNDEIRKIKKRIYEIYEPDTIGLYIVYDKNLPEKYDLLKQLKTKSVAKPLFYSFKLLKALSNTTFTINDIPDIYHFLVNGFNIYLEKENIESHMKDGTIDKNYYISTSTRKKIEELKKKAQIPPPPAYKPPPHPSKK